MPARAQNPPPASEPQPPAGPGVRSRFGLEDDHPALRIGDLDVVFRARLETMFRTGSPIEDGVDGDWRRRRVQVEGRYRRLEYEFSHEFGDPQEPERDAFVNYRVSRAVELQAGRFKVPFGREALASGANIDFVHRSLLGRQLSPGRDVGVMVHGRLADGVIYDAGYFLHDGDNSRSPSTDGGSRAVAGRVEYQPFTNRRNSRLEDLEVGVAVVRSRLDQVLALRGESIFGDSTFFDRVFANGRRLRIGLDAEWSRGPFGLAGEFVHVADTRQAMGLDGEDLPGIGATGWYASGTWVITGERKRARVEPRRNLLEGGPGAIEVAARLDRMRFGDVTYPGGVIHGPRAGDLAGNAEWVSTLGVNWFVHDRVKVQGNVIFETISDPTRSPAPRNNGRLTSGVINLQFVL